MTIPEQQAHLLTLTLCHPERARSYSVRQWEQLVWQSRAAEFFEIHGRIAAGIEGL